MTGWILRAKRSQKSIQARSFTGASRISRHGESERTVAAQMEDLDQIKIRVNGYFMEGEICEQNCWRLTDLAEEPRIPSMPQQICIVECEGEKRGGGGG